MEKQRFDFVANRKIFFTISIAIVIIGIISIFVRGFNFGIDFAGGTTMQVNMKTEVTMDVQNDLISLVEETIGEKPSIQKTGDGQQVIIKTKQLDTEQRDSVFNAIKEKYSLEDSDRLDTSNVTATVGKDLQRSAILATAVASVLMLIYIAFRFEFVTAVSSVIALLHDIFVMLTIYSLFQLPINSSYIAGILTILGYSINATIVVFDRIRENKKANPRSNFRTLVNSSIWQTMARCINTTLTTLFVIVALYVVGVPSIKEFSLPILIGILAGVYSSICLSGNLWVLLEEKLKLSKKSKNQKPKKEKKPLPEHGVV